MRQRRRILPEKFLKNLILFKSYRMGRVPLFKIPLFPKDPYRGASV